MSFLVHHVSSSDSHFSVRSTKARGGRIVPIDFFCVLAPVIGKKVSIERRDGPRFDGGRENCNDTAWPGSPRERERTKPVVRKSRRSSLSPRTARRRLRTPGPP